MAQSSAAETGLPEFAPHCITVLQLPPLSKHILQLKCQSVAQNSTETPNKLNELMCRLEKKEDGSIDFYYQGKDGETKCLNCGLVLFGTGRKPIVHDMGLEVTLAFSYMAPLSSWMPQASSVVCATHCLK